MGTSSRESRPSRVRKTSEGASGWRLARSPSAVAYRWSWRSPSSASTFASTKHVHAPGASIESSTRHPSAMTASRATRQSSVCAPTPMQRTHAARRNAPVSSRRPSSQARALLCRFSSRPRPSGPRREGSSSNMVSHARCWEESVAISASMAERTRATIAVQFGLITRRKAAAGLPPPGNAERRAIRPSRKARCPDVTSRSQRAGT